MVNNNYCINTEKKVKSDAMRTNCYCDITNEWYDSLARVREPYVLNIEIFEFL